MTDVTPFTIDAFGLRFEGGEERWADDFRRTGALHCPRAIAPPLLHRLRELADGAAFRPDDLPGLGRRAVERAPVVGNALALLLRRAPLFRWLERVTGCGGIGTVEGRLTRLHPGTGDGLGWHDDGFPGRRLAVTVALTDGHYEGGLFEMRRKGETALLVSHAHRTPGSVLIFSVDPGLEHRVTPVTAGSARQVFAGWFLAPAGD